MTALWLYSQKPSRILLRKSKIFKINKKAWKKPIMCDKELLDIIKAALHYSKVTNGGFDITEGPLAEGLNKNRKELRKSEDIAPLLNAATYKNIVIDENKNGGIIFFKDKLTRLDLSPVVNGYVVDKAVKVLRNNGVSDLT